MKHRPFIVASVVTLALACGVFAAGCSSAQSDSSSSEEQEQENTTQVVQGDYKTVTADEVENRSSDIVLVDVRTSEEYAQGHIPGALNASYPASTGGPCQSADNASTFRTNWAQLGISQDASIILYCRTGVRASAAANALLDDGYTDISVYEGSWTDWTSDANRPTES